jgi:hypothetical protein
VPLRSEPNIPSGAASGWSIFFGVGLGGTATAFVVCMGGATTTSVSCSPSSVLAGTQTSCTATVSDVDGSSSSTPSGPVSFSSNSPGTFTPSTSCDLLGTGALSSCSLQFRPSGSSVGVVSITTTYSGDASHQGSIGSVSLDIYDFALTATPSDQTVLRGGSAPFTVITSLVPGSVGAPTSVGVLVSGLPADASSGSSTLALPGMGTVTIQTGSASLGNFALTVSATVPGGVRSVGIGLHIYDFTLTALPGSLQVLTTGSNNYSVSATLVAGSSATGLPAIGLTLSGLPMGATGAFNPNSGTPSFASTLTITTASVASGSYTLTVSGMDGRAPQGGTHSTDVTLVVLTPALALQLVVNEIENFEASGVLDRGQANSLIVKLSHAIENMNNLPDKKTACNQLSAFVHEVNAYAAAGILSVAQADTLFDGPIGVLATIAAIPCSEDHAISFRQPSRSTVYRPT